MKMKNVSKKLLILGIIIFFIISMPVVNLAHSGRTDSNGGHKDNKNASGLGSYHYHCGGNPAHLHTGGVCPYSSAAAPTSAPAQVATPAASSSTKQTKQTTPAKVNPTSIEIDEDDFEIILGESKTLNATVSPSNATDKSITWKSSNKKVVMIDSEGELVAMGIGEATIIASTSNGKQSTVKVTVNPIKVSEIKLSENNLNMKIEDKVTITAEVLPENATDKTIEWASENPDIVTVENGIITANSSGTTKIICKSKDGVQVEVNIVVEEEEIIEENTVAENTVEVVTSADENLIEESSSTSNVESNSDSSGLAGAATLGAMVGVPVYLYKKKKK